MNRPAFMLMGQLESERTSLQREARIDYCVRKWWHILKGSPLTSTKSFKLRGVNHLFYLCVCHTFKDLNK